MALVHDLTGYQKQTKERNCEKNEGYFVNIFMWC